MTYLAIAYICFPLRKTLPLQVDVCSCAATRQCSLERSRDLQLNTKLQNSHPTYNYSIIYGVLGGSLAAHRLHMRHRVNQGMRHRVNQGRR